MDNKISTSIQYQVSNVYLLREVFYNWGVFNDNLDKGPETMKMYLFDMWNSVKEQLRNNEQLLLKDLDKEVKVTDFDVTYNRTKNGTSIFFITFPDYDYTDAASKYVALALTPQMPRYFTLEYSKNYLDNTPCWVMGEFAPEGNGFKHMNYGPADNMRLTWYCGYIINKLESENL